jgi:hypothetical protein
MGGGHSQNMGLDLTLALSEAPYFENAPILGFTLHYILTNYQDLLIEKSLIMVLLYPPRGFILYWIGYQGETQCQFNWYPSTK